jgi:hypothetical protein
LATGATGTPSSPDNIPTLNPDVDDPDGEGINSIVAGVQTAVSAVRTEANSKASLALVIALGG